MHGSAKRREQPYNVLIGTGDSTFFQLPCPLAPLHHAPAGSTSKGSKIVQISCGATAAVALVVPAADTEDEAPQMLGWGTDLYGERLLPDERLPPAVPLVGPAPLNHPTVVSPWSSRVLGGSHLQTIRSIACGAHFVVAAIATGGCISWGRGRGSSRTLGHGGCGSCLSPSCNGGSVPANPPSSCAGEPDWVAEPLGPRGLSVTDLAVGDDHAVAVCADGSAWAWGRGDCGQLGLGPPAACSGDGGACRPTRVRIPMPFKESSPAAAAAAAAAAVATTAPAVVAAIVNPINEARRSSVAHAAACGRDHSAILTSDGRLLTFGSGLHGQLGLGTVGKMAWTPTAVDALGGVGTMRTDGSFTGIASVACGAWHTAALSTTGDVYTWGWARFGALGPSPGDEPVRRKTDEDEGTKREGVSSGKGNFASSTEERAEVRPYPGLVEGVENLLENDRIVSVACGGRYTLALSLKKRAFVWGQVEPSADGGAAGFGPRCSRLVNSGPPSNLFCHPRELRPSELLRAAAAARSTGGSQTARCCGNDHEKEGRATLAVEGGGTVKHSESRWRVSTVGCGPWYIVFGIEEEEGHGEGGLEEEEGHGEGGQLS